jgi:ankyrin repeat protein
MARTPNELFAAIGAGDPELLRAILERDPSLAMARDANGVSALMRARYRLDRDLVDAVRSRVDTLDVFEAAALGDVDRLVALLDVDESLVAARSSDGFTPLHLAAFFGGVDAAKLLLARGADVDAAGTGWMTGTALHSAASARRVDVGLILLGAGADPNRRQTGGFTPLHAAAANGDVAFVRALLSHGAEPGARTDDGRSTATFAQERGDAETIAALGGG